MVGLYRGLTVCFAHVSGIWGFLHHLSISVVPIYIAGGLSEDSDSPGGPVAGMAVNWSGSLLITTVQSLTVVVFFLVASDPEHKLARAGSFVPALI